MSEAIRRWTAPSPGQILTRVLEHPHLVAAVQALPAAALGKLIGRIGLEDAGEIVALATTEQVLQMFDEDLWRGPTPGDEEAFDAERFLLWIEVLAEVGDTVAAERLSELPEDLVIYGFHRHVLVLNLEEWVTRMVGDDDEVRQAEKALESCLSEEFDEFKIMARRHDGWDTLVSVLAALDRDHHDFLQRVLERCSAMDAEYIEENGGLYEVLTSEEMLEEDLAADREGRRAERGYVAPSAARSFLALSRVEDIPLKGPQRDALTKAYFRDLKPETPASVGGRATTARSNDESSLLHEETLMGLLRDAAPPVAGLLVGKEAALREEVPLFTRVMTLARERDTDLFHARLEELAYLTNVLVAGASLRGRRLRPIEAMDAAVAVCSLGLDLVSGRGKEHRKGVSVVERSFEALRQQPADRLFRAALFRLHHDVGLPAVRGLARWLLSWEGKGSPAISRSEIRRAAAVAQKAFEAGKPWIALGCVHELGMSELDPDLEALTGLVDECPTLDGSLRGAGFRPDPGRRGGGTPAFVASRRQMNRAIRFVRSIEPRREAR